MTTAIRLHPMHQRPRGGTKIVVLMRDGTQSECWATMVYTSKNSGIVIYHNKKAIDENDARGWWPATINKQ